jgi:hypothetical protein
MRVCDAGDGANAHPLAEQVDNLGRALQSDPHSAENVGRFRPGLAAFLAAEALGAGSGFSVRAAVLVLTDNGYHGDFPWMGVEAIIQLTRENWASARFSSPR